MLVALIWFPHAFFRKVRTKHAGFRVEGLWRDRLAWQVTLFMGLQSALAYCVFGWLSPILRERGLDGVTAGVVVSVSVMAQVFACLLVPSIAVRCKDQRLINVALVALAVTGLLGFLFAPLSTVWLWAVVQGLGQGGLIAIAMTIIVLRSAECPRRLASFRHGAMHRLYACRNGSASGRAYSQPDREFRCHSRAIRISRDRSRPVRLGRWAIDPRWRENNRALNCLSQV